MQVLETPTKNVVSFSPLLRQYTLEEFWDLAEPKDRAHYELIKEICLWFHHQIHLMEISMRD